MQAQANESYARMCVCVCARVCCPTVAIIQFVLRLRVAVPLLQDAIYINYASPAALLCWHRRMERNSFVLQMAVAPFSPACRRGRSFLRFVFPCWDLFLWKVFLKLFHFLAVKSRLLDDDKRKGRRVSVQWCHSSLYSALLLLCPLLLTIPAGNSLL